MNDCIYIKDGRCELETEDDTYPCTAQTRDETCEDYAVQTELRASVQAAMDAGVPPRGGRRAFDADDLGGEVGGSVESVPDSDVPAGSNDPTASRDHCRSEIRPLVFGVARPGPGYTTVPVFVMVCGVALDGRCPSPCYFGMYSSDIGRAHAAVEPTGRIITTAAGVSDVRRGQ